MEFANFTTLVRDEVEKRVGKGYRIRLNDVRKNNGIVLKGLTVMQDDSNISPTIYLNRYYEEYANGKMTFSGVVDNVMKVYNRNRVNQCVDMRYFLNYEDVKSHIIYKLINTERNKELLEEIPHVGFLDLSIVFQCLVSQEELGIVSILIHNKYMKLWDVTTDELYQVAKENTQRLQKYEIKSMAEVLCEVMKAEDPKEFNHEEYVPEFSDSVQMYVLSNKSRVEGAACMLYPNLIRDFADAVGSSLYIIPSSIHELLLLPTVHDEESGDIKNMIREINDTQVSTEEILSFSLYFYKREEDRIVRL